jgi:hypothetical protein
MILIDFSNNETIEFQDILMAGIFMKALSSMNIKVLGIHCSDTEATKTLQDYLEELNNSIT